MKLVIIRGGGDLATGIGYRLFMAGFQIIILEIEKPLTVRRTVSFSEAVYRGETTVEGVKAVLCDFYTSMDILSDGNIPVIIDPNGNTTETFKPMAVVDCIMAKENLGTNKNMAPITIGVGPGFNAGEDVELVIESNRGHNLGRVIYKGYAESNTGIPSSINGISEGRIIRAPKDGIIKWNINFGDIVRENVIIGNIDEMEIRSKIEGKIRGLIKGGLYVNKGLKIGDIDPRGEKVSVDTISDKARAIGGGVLEGILYMKNHMVLI